MTRCRRRAFVLNLLLAIVASVGVPLAAQDQIGRPEPIVVAEGLPGTLILAGNPASPEVVGKFVELAGKDAQQLLIVGAENDTGVRTLEPLLKAKSIEGVSVVAPSKLTAGSDIKSKRGVWIANVNAWPDTLHKLVDHWLSERTVVVLSDTSRTAWKTRQSSMLSDLELRVVDEEMAAQGKAAQKFAADLVKSPGKFGLLLADDSDVVIRGREIRQLGKGAVQFILPALNGRPARIELLDPQGVEDLTLWRRAGRLQRVSPIPTAGLARPIVERGSLVIVGGGGMTEDVGRKFVELAGGADAPIVILPTSMPDPIPNDSGISFLKRYGANNLRVLTARKRSEVESADFLSALREAKGIWFGGGRQWRFVDAYEGTLAYPLIHDVLKRGGVIGGSSAGATIQGDYLIRGSPHGPQFMMCEGYERGFNFLPGVAIDQHFAQRKRFPDMTALMKVYPQYLGIGLDEATAIVVERQIATVMGRGQVHVYDRRQQADAAADKDYQSLSAGTRFDLVERRIIATPPAAK